MGHPRSRSRLYERYDVDIGRSRGRSSRSRYNQDDDDDAHSDASTSLQRLRQRNNKLLLLAIVALLALKVWSDNSAGDGGSDAEADAMNGDTSRMSASRVRNSQVSKRTDNRQREEHQSHILMDEGLRIQKRWNPCLNSKFELERHDHEPRHGDVCRAKGGTMGLYECPEGCHDTAGNAPYCANDAGTKGKTTMGEKGRACRVRNPDAPPEYRCDGGAVCVLAVGTPKEQFKGRGKYYDDTCDNKCGDGRKGELTPWLVEGGKCAHDMDCSLAGVCTPEGTCKCDLWAEGADCSYLRFAPVDKGRLGYLDEQHSSWGGSIVQKSNGEYHMYVSEIICKEEGGQRGFFGAGPKRCGLNNWETHSRIAQATSSNIDGPYQRMESHPVVLHPEHHNPSVHVSPTTGHWHLYTISGPTGPIERMVSRDEGTTWGVPVTVSPRQNPGPLFQKDGSVHLYYRADGLDIPTPTCSDEGISFQFCPAEEDAPCEPPNDELVLRHTGEDPSVFVDHRGHYHMLFNALPYKCVPKHQQGGHAWSLDGIHWSDPRIGAFDTTIQFTDGTSMKCERRERPQMVMGKDGKPVAMVSAVTGCPKALGEANSNGNGRFYKGADDSFTLVQTMGSKPAI